MFCVQFASAASLAGTRAGFVRKVAGAVHLLALVICDDVVTAVVE